MSFFDTFYETTFVIENEIIRFRLDNVRLPSGSLVTVEGAENLLLTSWRSLVQKITGSSSHIRNGLMATANELFGDIVQDTEKRLKGNIKRVNEIESDIKSGENNFFGAFLSLPIIYTFVLGSSIFYEGWGSSPLSFFVVKCNVSITRGVKIR